MASFTLLCTLLEPIISLSLAADIQRVNYGNTVQQSLNISHAKLPERR